MALQLRVCVNYSHCKAASDFDAIKNLTHIKGASIYLCTQFLTNCLEPPSYIVKYISLCLARPCVLEHNPCFKAKLIKLFVYLSSWKNTCDSGTNTWATRVSLALRRKGRGIIYALGHWVLLALHRRFHSLPNPRTPYCSQSFLALEVQCKTKDIMLWLDPTWIFWNKPWSNVHCLHDVAVVLRSCRHFFGIMLPPPLLNLLEGDGIVHNTASLLFQNRAVTVPSRSRHGPVTVRFPIFWFSFWM